MLKTYLFLIGAIFFEVAGTMLLPVTQNFTTEASIHTNLFRDLYIVLGEGNSINGWVVRIYYNPLVMWIWIGAILIFLGGMVSLNTNIKKFYTNSKN